jgi:hypothetical protein
VPQVHQFVRHGRKIEARSASSCWVKAGEAARCAQNAASNFDNGYVGIVGAAQIRVNVRSAAGFSGRAARGSVDPRKIACRPPAEATTLRPKAIVSR